MTETDLGGVARDIIDANLYMVLATANDQGRPWASPVYYAHAGYELFFWVSSPQATHSHNLAARRDLGIVVFDSQVPIGTGQGVYMAAVGQEAAGEQIERGMEVFSRRSIETGGVAWSADDVTGEAPLRLYQAAVTEHSVLAKDGRPDHRTVVDILPEREP